MGKKSEIEMLGGMYVPWTKTYEPSETAIDGKCTSYMVDDNNIIYCCNEMEEHYGGIAEYYAITSDLDYNRDTEKSVYVPSITGKSSYDSEDGYIRTDQVKIKYCPFCGKPIYYECTKVMEKVVKECKEVTVKKPVYETREVKE